MSPAITRVRIQKHGIMGPWVQLLISRLDLFGRKFSERVTTLRLIT